MELGFYLIMSLLKSFAGTILGTIVEIMYNYILPNLHLIVIIVKSGEVLHM